MGVGTFIHHIGTVFLLVATVLLIIADISSPVIDSISMLRVDFGDNTSKSDFTFGTLGYCQLNVDGEDICSHKMIGYNPAKLLEAVDNDIDFGSASEDTSKGLTRVMVLHIVGTIFAFIAFLLCIGTNTFFSLLASIFSGLAFIVTIVATACNFVAFSIVKHKVNEVDGNKATYGAAIWCVLAAAILTFFATIIVFFTCCAGRRKRKHDASKEANFAQDTVPKKKFWQRR